MRENQTKTIDGHEYTFSQFGAKQSLKILVRICKVVGQPLVMTYAAVKGTGPLLDRQIDGEMLSKAVRELMANMDEDSTVTLIDTLCGKDAALCDGKPIIFDQHYEGRLDHLFRVLQAALEVQYGNFIGAVLELQGAIRPPVSNQAPAT